MNLEANPSFVHQVPHFRGIVPGPEHHSYAAYLSDGIHNLMTIDVKFMHVSSVQSYKTDERNMDSIEDGDDGLQ